MFWKYEQKHMDLTKQARILDHMLIGALPKEKDDFPLVFKVRSCKVGSGDWSEN